MNIIDILRNYLDILMNTMIAKNREVVHTVDQDHEVDHGNVLEHDPKMNYQNRIQHQLVFRVNKIIKIIGGGVCVDFSHVGEVVLILDFVVVVVLIHCL